VFKSAAHSARRAVSGPIPSLAQNALFSWSRTRALGEFQQATRAAMRAIDLSPGFALGHLVLGMATLYSGRAEQAKACLQHGLRLNWSDPHNFAWFDLLALAHLLTGRTEEALEAATEALHLRPIGK
jgi:predicted Zn-dependent protease